MWDAIKFAIDTILSGQAKRIDGDGWLVYAVGDNIVRVDIKTVKYKEYVAERL